VSFTPQRSNLILRGHFNPYIFSPEWLISIGLIREEEEINLNLGALGDGVQFACDRTAWKIEPGVFAVDTSNTSKDLGRIGSEILGKLPHTPITAVGFNFQYKVDTDNKWLVPVVGSKSVGDLVGFPKIALTKWGVVFHENKTRIELSVSIGDQGVIAVFNFHTPIETENLIGSAPLAAEVCGKFEASRLQANDLLSKLLDND
jgi:hypothetical protein